MTVGMEIYTAAGVLQISTNFLSYFCRKSSSGTTVARVNGTTTPSSVVIDVTGYTNPIIAFICGQSMAFTGRNGTSSQNLTFACDGAIGTSFTYFIFDQSTTLPVSHYGLELYNASGQRVFTSDAHPMLALQTLISASGAAVTAAGRTLAVAPMTWGGHRLNGGTVYCLDAGVTIWDGVSSCTNLAYDNDGKVYGGNAVTTTVTPAAISFDDVRVAAGSSPPGPTFATNYDTPVTMLVIDVTGIPLATTFF